MIPHPQTQKCFFVLSFISIETEEANNLKIVFYPAMYHDLFASIFATVDICQLIPNEEADIAILEEPEHLNWFRVPPVWDESRGTVQENNNKDDALTTKSDDGAIIKREESQDSLNAKAKNVNSNQDQGTNISKRIVKMTAREIAELGWAMKFNHVVGILHTNYSAYMRQYGMGTSFIAASALGALSSIVVRAYCHKVIRLSATLPPLDPSKEVTCNVHGVRSEFFAAPSQSSTLEQDVLENPAPIYFIGKLIWAKGFDKLLQIQELYKEEIGEYFPMDVYGSGGDAKAINRAFFGRKGIVQDGTVKPEEKEEENLHLSSADQTAALMFARTGSLRGQLEQTGATEQDIEVQLEGDSTTETTSSTSKQPSNDDSTANDSDSGDGNPNILDILGDLSGKTMITGKRTTRAVGKLTEKLVGLGFNVAFSKETKEDVENTDPEQKHTVRFDPPKTRFELRRKPLPARFLGVKDHALIRDVTQHKIFLNMSETEVLCTTTAEALAMGKFAIIPKHRKCNFVEKANLFCISLEFLVTCDLLPSVLFA